MSMENPFDNPYNYGDDPNHQSNQNWNVQPLSPPPGQNMFGYNPSGDMVGQTNINAYSANPQSFMAGWSPPDNLTPNVFGTNQFDPSQAYTNQSSASPSSVNAGLNAAYNPPTTAGAGSSSSTGSGSSGGSTGSSGGSTAANPESSSGGKGGGFEQTVWSDPSNFYLNYNRAMSNAGINPATGTPMAQMMSRAASRAYSDFLARGLAGDAPLDDTTASIGDFMARGGRPSTAGGGINPAQNLMNLYQQVINGTLTGSDPRYDTVAMLRDNPTLVTQLFTNLGPQTPGSRYRQQYLQDAANYAQVNGQTTPRNYMDALLRALGAVA